MEHGPRLHLVATRATGLALAGALAVTLLVGCGDDGDGATSERTDGDDPSTTTEAPSTASDAVESAPLPYGTDGIVADEAIVRAEVSTVPPGTQVSFVGELLATVDEPVVGGDLVEADVVVENVSELTLSLPSVTLVCADGAGTPLVEPAGELDPGAVLDPGARARGRVSLALPDGCQEPLLRVTVQPGSTTEVHAADWAVA